MRPPPQNETAPDDVLICKRGQAGGLWHQVDFIEQPPVSLTLESVKILTGRFPIQAEAAAAHLPGIVRFRSIRLNRFVSVEIFSINPEVQILSQFCSIPYAR